VALSPGAAAAGGAGTARRLLAIPGLEADGYQRHWLHAEDRVWVGKNCYIDVWTELVHALKLNPVAMLAFTVAVDFEGDQWTFFKPPHDELRTLYGIDVQELNVWRPLVEHAVEYLAAGKLICTEADAFWLPDTSGTDYRRQHTKSTIILADIDLEQRRLGYFHNAGYFCLQGEDFVNTFRIGFAADPTFMPLFAEAVRTEALVHRSESDLMQQAKLTWRRHLERIPHANPVVRFMERLEADLPDMQQRGLSYYHAWAFATVRQLGAAFELAAQNLRWMQGLDAGVPPDAIVQFEAISAACKTFILKGARAVNARRPLAVKDMLSPVAEHWDRGTAQVREWS
jgi:hypothetical protein